MAAFRACRTSESRGRNPGKTVIKHYKKVDSNLKKAKELEWLLNSLQETFASLKNGLEECKQLLAPTEHGSTLVVSSMRSENVKGFITRVGTRIVKAVGAKFAVAKFIECVSTPASS